MNNTDFLYNFLFYIPGIIVALYSTFYLTMHFSFFRPLEKRRNEIRLKVAAQWEQKHGGFIGIIDNIDFKYFRVLLRQRINENKQFRLWQGLYVVYSIGIVLMAVFFKSCRTIPYSNHIMFTSIVLFAIASTVIIITSYYEWKFYKLLDELDTMSYDRKTGHQSLG